MKGQQDVADNCKDRISKPRVKQLLRPFVRQIISNQRHRIMSGLALDFVTRCEAKKCQDDFA